MADGLAGQETPHHVNEVDHAIDSLTRALVREPKCVVFDRRVTGANTENTAIWGQLGERSHGSAEQRPLDAVCCRVAMRLSSESLP